MTATAAKHAERSKRQESSPQPANTGTLRVAVIIPAYNEQECLERVVDSLTPLRECQDLLTTVVIVNDGSHDRTGQIARRLEKQDAQIVLLDLPYNGGIGTAMQAGFLYASRQNFDFAVQFDADGQHRGGLVAPLVRHAHKNRLDLCIGSRFLNMDQEGFRSTFFRRLGIIFFARLISLLTRTRATDPTSGFRVSSRRAIKLFARSYPDDYPEPEALFWCARNHLRVGEHAVLMNERQGGTSSIRYLRTAYYMLKVTTAIIIDFMRRKEWSEE